MELQQVSAHARLAGKRTWEELVAGTLQGGRVVPA